MTETTNQNPTPEPNVTGTHDIRADGALDPCLPVRNLGGHLVTCAYGDWADFSKCDCAEGLAGIPATRAAYQVSPLPLRDLIAAHTHVSDAAALDLAIGMSQQRAADQRIQLLNDEDEGGGYKPTIMEMADAKAKLRYLEADAMISWRAESAEIQRRVIAERKAAASANACICGHDPALHQPTQTLAGVLPGECTECNCENFTARPEAVQAGD